MFRHNCQSCGEITVDLLANRKSLNRLGAKHVISAILRLMLLHVLMESLELKLFCENIAFVLNDNINNTLLHSF